MRIEITTSEIGDLLTEVASAALAIKRPLTGIDAMTDEELNDYFFGDEQVDTDAEAGDQSGPCTLEELDQPEQATTTIADTDQSTAAAAPATDEDATTTADRWPEWDRGIAKISALPCYTGTNDDYFDEPYLNWSTLKRFLDDPRWFKNHSDPGTSTTAQNLGTMIHCALLEPERFADCYKKFVPPINATTGEPYKSGKKYEEALSVFAASGKYAITDDQLYIINEIKQSLTDNGLTKYLHSTPCNNQHDNVHSNERVVMDEQAALKCKIDLYHEEFGIIDIKTTSSSIPHRFRKDLFRYSYIEQLAYYAYVVWRVTGKRPPCSILAVETSAPFRSSLIKLTDDTIEDAIEKIVNNYLPKYRDYLAGESITNDYSEEI